MLDGGWGTLCIYNSQTTLIPSVPLEVLDSKVLGVPLGIPGRSQHVTYIPSASVPSWAP